MPEKQRGSDSLSIHKIGLQTAVSIVVANMIGTGVFTSLGFQVADLHQVWSILLLWILGGILALCGAFVYAEIGSAFPENGGEYNYLSRLYHPALGFMSGWVSVTVGFAAPIAAATVAMADYVSKVYPNVNAHVLSTTVILGITLFHAFNMKAGSAFQRVFTYVKLASIVFFILSAAFYHPRHSLQFGSPSLVMNEVFSQAFALSLVFVTYAYSGWNAASYIAGEIRNTSRNLPKALVLGTVTVAMLYTLLNYVFLYTVPVTELKGVVEVAHPSAVKLYGSEAGAYMSLLIAVLLVSTVSAMILAGPRVMQSMGKEIRGLQFLAIANRNQVPYLAVILQSLLALILVYTSSFKSLITYVSFTLNLFTLLTVGGLFILRTRFRHLKPAFRTPLYPLVPLLFIAVVSWVLLHIIYTNTTESVYGLITVFLGFLIYFVLNRKRPVVK
ncbi:MAG TPA: amino acid permease [Bacteroidia bacterium]|nr:amino acid permease [Bacteroidia bacterium]